MKKLFYSILFYSILFYCLPLSAQNNLDGNLYEFMKLYYDSTRYDVTDTAESGGNEEFKRTVLEMYPRLFPSGSYNVATTALYDYVNDFRQNQGQPTPNGAGGASCHWENMPIYPYSGNTEDIGRINKVAFDPRYGTNGNQTLYAASPFGGLFRSTDNGDNWESYYTDSQLPYLGVSDIVFGNNGIAEPDLFISTGRNEDNITPFWTPFRGNENYLATSGVYRFNATINHWDNIDGGLFTLFSDGGNMRRMIGHPTDNNTLIVATTIGVYRTTNALAANPASVQWTLLTDATNLTNVADTTPDVQFRGLAYHPTNPNTIYASGKDIYVSYNAGVTWESFTYGTNWQTLEANNIIERINITTSPLLPDMLFVHLGGGPYINASTEGTMKEINYFDGTTWRVISHNYTSSYKRTLNRLGITLSHTKDGAICLWAGDVWLYRFSYDSLTATFSYAPPPIKRHTDFLDYAYAPNSNNIFMYASDGGVATSTNNGTNFIPKNDGLQVAKLWEFDDTEYGEDIVVVSQQDCGTRMKLTGNAWQKIFVQDGYGSAIVGNSVFYRANGLYFRKDFTQTAIGPLINEMALGAIGYEDPNIMDYRPLAKNWQKTIKDFLPVRFSAMDDPKDFNAAYFGFTEIHRRNVVDADTSYIGGMDTLGNYVGNPNYPALWTTISDIHTFGNLADRQSRGIMAAAMSESHTYPMYVATDYELHGYPEELVNAAGILTGTHIPHLFKIDYDALSGQLVTTEIVPNGSLTSIPSVTYADVSPPYGNITCVAMITGIVIHPTDPNKVWITITGYEANKRVFYSPDKGMNWYNSDANGNLPNLPANCIVYQKGTNDRLFIGTDAGVYMKEGNGNWQKFGDCFPNVRVSQLKINYCSGKLRAATYGRGLWESELPSLGEYANERVVISDETWADEIVGLSQNLRIKSGAKLTLTGILNMPVNGLITVEKGAKFIIDGGKITNQCNQMWQGIIVEGDTMQNQFADMNGNYAQGYLECKNGATIEYAHDAVMLWNPYIYNEHGGIVKATDSHFLNNRRSVSFMAYQNTSPGTINPAANASYFKNCTFDINNDYRRSDFWAHITAWKVDGIPIQGCDFKYTRTQGITDKAQMGKGIFTIDANFLVTDYCNSNTVPCPANAVKRSTFQGLNYGIHALSENGLYAFAVNKTDFSGNLRNIQSDKVSYFSATQNDFVVGNNLNVLLNPALEYAHYGIVSHNTTGYRIEENALQGTTNASAQQYSLGIVAANSGGEENVVYRNTYQHLYVGDYGAGENRNKHGGGLQFLCGDHSEEIYDISVTPMGNPTDPFYSTGTQGIKGVQKMVEYDVNGTAIFRSAGNEFSLNANNPESDYLNHSPNEITYFRHTGLGEPASYTPPNGTYGGVSLTFDPYAYYCPSNINEGFEGELTELQKSSTKIKYNTAENEYANLLYNYNELLDQGNTSQLVANIQLTWSDDTWTLRSQLLSRAPYLSEEALIEALDLAILPNAMIMEILLANPDVLRSTTMVTYFKDELPNFPQYMLDILLAYRNTETVRTMLENAIAVQKQMMAFSANRLLQDFFIYPNESQDTLLVWLNRIPFQSVKYTLAEYYANKGQYENALTVLSTIPTDFANEGFNTDEHSRYIDIFTLRKNVAQSNRTMAALTELEKASLISIRSASDKGSSVLANNILCFWYGDCEELVIPLPEYSPQLRNSNIPPSSSLANLQNHLTISPNPAKGFAIFEYEIISTNNAFIQVYDITGKLVQTLAIPTLKGEIIWDTHKHANGLYLYELMIDKGKVAVGKIVVEN